MFSQSNDFKRKPKKILQEVLSHYDDTNTKRFSYYDVRASLSELPDYIKNSLEAQSEFLAFSFQDNTGKKHWGSYLGPMTTWRRKDNDEEVLYPDFKDIKKEDIKYWIYRATETKNPLMKMRYNGLLYDFQQKVTSEKASYQSIIMPYLNAILEVIEGNYVSHSVEGYYYAKRALDVASSIRNTQMFERAQLALWNYDRHYKDDLLAPGLWGRHFNLMLKYIEKYQRYESSLVDELEARFIALEVKDNETGDKTDKYVHIMNEVTDLLCDYYIKKSNTDKIKDYIGRFLAVAKSSFGLRGSMWAQTMLQSIQTKYRKYHCYKEANRLFVDIQDLGASALQEMTRQEFSVPIDKEALAVYLNYFVQGTPQDVYVRYIVSNIPNMASERQRQEEEAEQSPLLDLVQTVTYDSNGNPLSNIDGGRNVEYEKLMYGMYRRMLITSIFLRMKIEKMIDNKLLSKDVIMDSFKDSPLMVKGQTQIIERGIDAYFNEDYLVACHLLIPQFESTIRRMVALIGGKVLRDKKDPQTGNEYVSLDGLLNSDEIKENLPEDVIAYFKNLFTEQNGWNLRNLSCHGLLPIESFSSTMADRIVHAFSVLSQLKLTLID